MRVLLAGGGSGGSATPILAVATELRRQQPSVELLFLGTHDGPEATLATEQGIRYVGVSTGKLRRYWDTQNIIDVGRIMLGVGQSLAVVLLGAASKNVAALSILLLFLFIRPTGVLGAAK